MEDKDLLGKHIIVTAGPTSAPIDPVRLLTNRSSGKMGYFIAEELKNRGARVSLISGTNALEDIEGVETHHILTNEEMYNKVNELFPNCNGLIMAAAVADYKIKEYSEDKIKKGEGDLTLTFVRDRDILKGLGEIKKDQVLIGFAAESGNYVENAKEKLDKKNLDAIVFNDVSSGKVFGKDTTSISIISKERDGKSLSKDHKNISKKEAAKFIVDELKQLMKNK